MRSPKLWFFVLAAVIACRSKETPPAPRPITGSGSAGSAAGSGSAAASDSSPIDVNASFSNADGTLKPDPALVTGKLPNGLTYYVLHNAKPEKRAELWLAVNAGSVLEDDDQRGLAHFVEHMAFNGTKKYPKADIVNWLEKIGMKFGADVNARTSWDDTVYQLTVPTDDPALVAHGLDVLHEWAQGVAFDPVEVDKERGVILEERRLGRGAQGRLLDKLVPAALPDSKYGQRLPIGLEKIIKTATPDTLKRFYHDWYRPDTMAVIVVGDVDPQKLQKQIADQFGDLVAPANARPRPDVAIPPQAKPVTLALNDPELPVTIVAVASKQPHVPVRDETGARGLFGDLLFSLMLNERLAELSKKDTAPFLTAQVGKQAILRPIDVWFQVAIVKGDRVPEALEIVSTEVARVAKFGFNDSELERAKKNVLQLIEVKAKEKGKTDSSDIVEEVVKMFLAHEIFTSPDQDLALTKKLMPLITTADMQAITTRAASADNRLVLAAGNVKTKLPDAAKLAAALTAGQAKATTAWVDDSPAGPLVATPPKPGTIASEKKLAGLGVTEWTLSNGVKVVLKPTDFQNDYVEMTGSWLGGTSLAGDADFIAAENAPAIIEASGAGPLSAVQLQKALTGTGVNLQLVTDDTGQEIIGGGQPDHFEQLLQLVHLRLTTPRKDPVAVAAWRDQEIQSRKHQLDDPATVFRAKFREISATGNPRYRLPTSDDFAKLDVDRAIAFYQDRLAHLGGLTFVIVGAFSIDTVKPLILTYLGGLSAGPAEHWKDLKVVRPTGAVTFEVKQGIEPKASVHLVFHVETPWTREAEHDLTDLASALSIRLREELREGMSGTYGVGVGGYFRREPTQIAYVDIQFGCAPENAEPLIKAAKAIIAKFQTDGPPPEVVDKIKETERRERETSLKKNDFWLSELQTSYRFGDDPSHVTTDGTLIEAMSVARLRDAANHFMGKDSELGVLRPAK